MNKLLKFFIICAIVLCVGFGLCIGGACCGGVDGINKVAEKYNWLEASPGKMRADVIEHEEFDSIEVLGSVELVLIGTEYMDEDNGWPLPPAARDAIKSKSWEEGMIILCHGENIAAPDCIVEEGVLKIQGFPSDRGTISMNFSSDDGIPKAVIFCGDKHFRNISTSNNLCDVTMLGVSYESAGISGSDNDVFMECVKSDNLTIEGDCTDVKLHGDFRGTTDIMTTDGDVVIETGINKDKYAMEISAQDGDIELDNGKIIVDDYPWEYSCQGGPNKIKVQNYCADVQIFFGDTLYQ